MLTSPGWSADKSLVVRREPRNVLLRKAALAEERGEQIS